MLSSLHIENIAVIKSADIDFSSGFHVLTGETGAGKSILIDSINLILGVKPSKDMIRSGEKTASVSAYFTEVPQSAFEGTDYTPDEDGCVLITRVFDIDGKTQTKLNGRAVPVSFQKQIVPNLISIHGQNDNKMLFSPLSHMNYLDAYAGNIELLDEYSKQYNALEECKRKITSLKRDEREKQRAIELLRYQISDIDGAKLKIGEEEELENRRLTVKNSEKIIKNSRLVMKALYRGEKALPAYELVKKSITAIEGISEYITDAKGYIDRLNSISYDLEDIALSVSDVGEGLCDDPESELDEIESRLDLITKMERKYGSSIDEILSFRDRSEKELKEIELSDELISDLKLEIAEYVKKCRNLADKISENRKKSAEVLEKQVVSELTYLEMPKVRFKIDIKPQMNDEGKIKLGRYGVDEVEFLISANPGEPLKPMAKIASGGELSRIMLALKNINSYDSEGQTLIFDEIDTGVSGKTSQKIGMRLRKLSEHHQVICVTHSAQIASEAHHQYLISKAEKDGRVVTDVKYLDREGRIKEIARIMGGVNITDKLIQSASEMLDNAGKE